MLSYRLPNLEVLHRLALVPRLSQVTIFFATFPCLYVANGISTNFFIQLIILTALLIRIGRFDPDNHELGYHAPIAQTLISHRQKTVCRLLVWWPFVVRSLNYDASNTCRRHAHCNAGW